MNRHIITIVPLGPDDAQMLTLGALETLRRAQHLVLRTQRHGVAELLKREGIAFETFDPLYEQCEDFDELCAQIADRLRWPERAARFVTRSASRRAMRRCAL